VPNPLPQFVSSLSKYYRAEDHYPLIASILHDTPESELRAQFGENLYATGRKRYLIVRNRIVIKDKLVDFVHEENGFTERVKMVMYFLFMFRDARYRQFMCEEVAKGGKWQTEIFRDTKSEYFKNAGGRKAFTNLRQFLFQTGVLDEKTLQAKIPDLSTWFPQAVDIAAQSIEGETAQKNFLANPIPFLIKHKINALLNASPRELSSVQLPDLTSEPDDPLLQIELPEGSSKADGPDFRDWDRLPPGKRQNDAQVFEKDPAALERANDQHYHLELRISDLCKKHELLPKSNLHVDLVVDVKDTSVLFEMKSCRAGAIRTQLRRAISQLLEYRFIYRERLKPSVILCAVLERKPGGRVGWLADFADSLGIGLIWKNDDNDRLNCTDATRARLRKLLPDVGAPNF
jgi:hypothetical protein